MIGSYFQSCIHFKRPNIKYSRLSQENIKSSVYKQLKKEKYFELDKEISSSTFCNMTGKNSLKN